MLVEDGKKAIARLVANQFKLMQLGDGGDDTSPKQTELDSAVTSKNSNMTVQVTNKQISFSCTFTGADINSTNINELGIFSDNSYSGTDNSKVNNILLARINFNNLGPFAANDTVNLTLVMEVAWYAYKHRIY